MSVYERFYEAVESDLEPWEKKSAQLKRLYKRLTPKQRQAVDDVLIVLCGWSLKTLIDDSK